MKKLLVICQGFPPFYGGAEHVAYYLAREAAASGDVEVCVLTSDLGSRLPAEEIMDGMRIVRVSTRKKEWTRHTVGELISFLRSARRRVPSLVDEFAPDHVLAHFSLPAGAIAGAVSNACGAPYSVVLHGSDVPGYQPKRFGLFYPCMRPMVRRIWKGAHRVISVADGLRELALTTWPKGDIAVIPNGVDTEYFRPAGDVSPKGDNAPMRAVVTAQLIERKGIQYLVEAIASMDEAYRQRLHVDVCGVGPYGASLRQQVSATGMEGCVTFRGLLEHEKMAELLRGADLFILPSLQEGTPVAVLEAMACGLPVIATKVGGLPALAADRRAVLLVEPGSSSQLQAALKQVMDDSGLRVELGHEARRVALEHGWHTVWQEYLRVLERNNA